MNYLTDIVCINCGKQVGDDIMSAACPHCESPWLDAVYDYEAVAEIWRDNLHNRERTLWRYHELLPFTQADHKVSMGEGFTSLFRLHQYEYLYPGPHLFVKDERQGPTGSFKDRQAAMAVMSLKNAGIRECVLASTGNAGVAYAAYCARANIKLWLFLAGPVPDAKMREAALYGAEVIKVSGTYDEAKKVAGEFARHKNIHLDRGAKAVPGKESMKTIAYEIAEQLGLANDSRRQGGWQSPDWYVQAVSGGIGPLAVWKGFSELFKMGLVDKMPKLAIVQAAGCAPMVNAFQAGQELAEPVIPKTLITVLATGDPGFSYVQLRQAVLSNGGTMLAIKDGDTFSAMRRLASKAGISVEPATAVAFAGLEKMLFENMIKADETVVINCSGHTFPAESHILGDQYAFNLQIDAAKDQATNTLKVEKLDSVFDTLEEQTTTILIVDDNSRDMRLIRRLVENYKQYRVIQAHNGLEGWIKVRDHKPDLVVTDLTMPEMDGFTLVKKIRDDVNTTDIPIVVVSAKSLTPAESKLLRELGIEAWTKGDFNTRELVAHIITTLGHSLPTMPTPRHKPDVSPTAPSQIASPDKPHKLLIIDDNPYDLKLIRRMLKKYPQYEIIERLTGRDGLKAAYTHQPDLILLDLSLPDMDGFFILDELKSNPELQDIPVIIVSARDISREENNQFSQNIESILMKSGFSSAELSTLIQHTLENHNK